MYAKFKVIVVIKYEKIQVYRALQKLENFFLKKLKLCMQQINYIIVEIMCKYN